MVIALFGLSLLMVVGGIAAVVQGFPYVRLESGLSMVIGGSTAASAGAILLGLAAILRQLRLSASPPAEAHDTTYPDTIEPATQSIPIAPALPPLPAFPDPVVARGSDDGVRNDLAEPGRAEPRPSEPASLPVFVPADERAQHRDRIEPELPRPPAPAEPAAMPPDLFEPSVKERDADRAQAAEPAEPQPPSAKSAPSEAQAGQAPSESTVRGERVVAGTYASGGNTYVMFSDGSIEADTPRGRFTFGSLEELKAFVEAGGENEARGAA